MATVELELAHSTVPVITELLPSVKKPVATNCWVCPRNIDGADGVTTIDTRTFGVTVSRVVPLIVPKVAVIVVVPVTSVAARPVFNPIVATVTLLLVQLAVPVRLVVVRLVKVPIAVNCWLRPAATEGLTGVTAMDTNSAGVTVRVVLLLIAPAVAEMRVVPGTREVARPAAFIVATDVLELVQATAVRVSLVLLA